MQTDASTRLSEERRALIARYLLAAPQPAGPEREEPMRREALAEAARRAAVADERSRREAAEGVARRTALASIAEEARRKAADERARREALEEIARRAAAAEAHHRREAAAERAEYEALSVAAAVEEQIAPAAPAGAQPIDHRSTAPLLQALQRLERSSDATAARLERLAWALVLQSALIAALAIAVFVRG